MLRTTVFIQQTMLVKSSQFCDMVSDELNTSLRR